MASTNNVVIKTGIKLITFSDDSLTEILGTPVFSKFRINPTSIKLAERALETASYFENFHYPDSGKAEDVFAINRELADKISYILGYDSNEEVFGVFAPLDQDTKTGKFFIEIIVDKIMEIVEPALKERQEAMQKRADNYTKKYEG